MHLISQSPNKRKALILGETTLCIQCVEYLAHNSWEVIAIVSNDITVIKWGTKNLITVLPIENLEKIEDKNFYLFSIINPYLIPESFLAARNVILALNYHDSLLPKYAGVNSTTWAILNNEASHGVTLHYINSKIDCGNIALQSRVDIEDDDTALSLNLKCSEAFLSLFQKAVTSIINDTLPVIEQNLSNRTYYGRNHIPENYAIINGITDLNSLSRLVRSLSFGDGYTNPVASVKVILNDRFYIVENLNIQIDENASDNDVAIFTTVRDIYGNKTDAIIRYNDLLLPYKLGSDDLIYLSNIKAQEHKNKRQIEEFIAAADALITVLDHLPSVSSCSNDCIEKIGIPDGTDINHVLTIIYIVLARFFNQNFIISLYNFDEAIPSNLLTLVENRGLISVDKEMLSGTFNQLADFLIKQQTNSNTIVKDFGYRYNLSLQTDIAISFNVDDKYINQHKVLIRFVRHEISIKGNSFYELQIKSITRCIKILFEQYTNNKLINDDLRKIKILSNTEYSQIVYKWNQNEKSYSENTIIHELFEEQVQRMPDSIALVYEDTKLTYMELNQRANQLAHYLRQTYDIKGDDLIVLCLDRSEYMLIAILAVLKSGAAYVPVDPGYPDERIGYILEDTKSNLIITNDMHYEHISAIVGKASQSDCHLRPCMTISVDSQEIQDRLTKYSTYNLAINITSNNLAYVIYTSGTTGKPKGVLQTHNNVCGLFMATNDLYGFTCKDTWTLFHSYVFDFSVWEMWGALVYGGKLVIPSYEQTRDLDLFYTLCKNEHVTILNLTPIIFYQFMQIALANFKENKLSNLKYVIFGGDKLNPIQLKQWFEYYGYSQPKLINMFGITETTVHVTYKEITPSDLTAGSNIGCAISNKKIYILDADLNLLPIGAIGELYISGGGLASGYLNMPELTANKFIANPFQTDEEITNQENGYLYKSGDLARYLANGEIEYIGRNDFQVKINGYRIELNEIEAVLLTYPSVKQAVVIVKEHKDKPGNTVTSRYLIAYVLSSIKINEVEVLEYLKQQLPEYMIPASVIHVEKFPLTINGKLDVQALPKSYSMFNHEYVAPESVIEKNLCKLYAEILELEYNKIGIFDSFFKLGGDSILAIRLVSQLKEHFQRNITVKDIFEAKNIFNVSKLIENSSHESGIENKYNKFSLINLDNYPKLDKDIEDIYPASYLQMGMLIESDLDDKGTYHDVFSYTIKAKYNKLGLLEIWDLLIKKHELLRAAFTLNSQNGWDIVIYKNIVLDLKVYNKENLSKLIDNERINKFDCTKPGLFRLIINKKADNFDFILSFHHSIADGWSIASLINEFVELYVLKKEIHKLPDLSYAEFIQTESLALNNQEYTDYWKKNLSNIDVTNNKWNFSEVTTEKKLNITSFNINTSDTKKIHNIINLNGLSLDTIFLLAYLRTLSFFMNSTDITLGLVTNNRLEKDGGDKQFGLFLNVIPYRYNLSGLKNNVNEDLLNIFKHKLELFKYKQLPYGFIKSLFGYNLYNCAFNFIHFDLIMENSQNYIESFNGYEKTSIKLFLTIIQNKNTGFKISLAGHNDFIDQRYLEYFMGYYKECMLGIINKLDSRICLNIEDYATIIDKYNFTEKPYPHNKTISQLFEAQAAKTPNDIALVYLNERLTYCELNQKANQLAYHIINTCKVVPENLIALYLDRNEYMLVAILAVFKIECAYVPIDINYPVSRIKYILKDTKAAIVLTNKAYQKKITKLYQNNSNICITSNYKILSIDAKNIQNKYRSIMAENLEIKTTASNLAYIMYTSGTTGHPKGIMVEHRGIVNAINSLYKVYDFRHGNKATAFTSYVFDVSLSEFFVILLRGGELHLLSEAIKHDAEEISTYLLHNKINYTYLPPVMLANLPRKIYPELVGVVYAGEACDTATGTYWSNNYKLFNYYGPTEASIYALGKQVINGDVEQIGKPICNTKAYVLNEKLNPLPFGVIGELYIGGAGIARGYFNNNELTQKYFILNPFQSVKEKEQNKNSRLYKTGDLVRMLPNGNIEYIGRGDTQIKIRGFRVETGEIENTINTYPGIRKSTVVVLEHQDSSGNLTGSKYLVGYYIISQNIDNKDKDGYVDDWENLYNFQYANLNINNYQANIEGWKSSYTGEAIPKEWMLEWRDETIKRIKNLQPGRILEIGSGSGLLLFNLIDNCKHYYATDFSSSAIKYTKQIVKNFGYQNKVTTIKCRADRLAVNAIDMKYDTVILNSVIQYFPNLEYLENVLNQLINNIDDVGQVFVGDIRDYRLLEGFYYSLLKFKNDKVTFSEINYFIRREKELLIAPAYFINFQKRNPSISYVEFLPKLGVTSNEMNCYRYDVILHVNKGMQGQSFYKNINNSDFIKILDIKEYLIKHNKNKYVYVKYPNKRIAKDYIECCILGGKQLDLSINNFDALLNLTDLSNIFTEEGFNVEFYLDIFDPLYINIIGFRDKKADIHTIENNIELVSSEMSNNPVYNMSKLLDNKHSTKLKEYLKDKLPSYMIPDYLIAVDKFPLNASGKIDSKLLPNPELIISNNYSPPKNQLENKICEIMAHILNLPVSKISIRDSFFDLGGNSILAIKLVSKINDNLAVKLKIAHIFVNKTVEKLALLVNELKEQSNLIINLNNISDKNNLFMIHPAFAGTEGYIDLARVLSSDYSCYGVDNYNLHHNNKISDLNQLANYYLLAIDEVRKNTGQINYPYLLLGWSLGGQIALEMASILEQRGYKDINIILIDSILPDDKIYKYFSALKVHENSLYKHYITQGYVEEYINNVISNFHYDVKLAQQKIKTKLKYTKVLLFKAMEKDSRKIFTNYNQLYKYTTNLEYNNVDAVVRLNHIKLIKLKRESHSTIINQVKLICNNIYSWRNNKEVV